MGNSSVTSNSGIIGIIIIIPTIFHCGPVILNNQFCTFCLILPKMSVYCFKVLPKIVFKHCILKHLHIFSFTIKLATWGLLWGCMGSKPSMRSASTSYPLDHSFGFKKLPSIFASLYISFLYLTVVRISRFRINQALLQVFIYSGWLHLNKLIN